jgi:hypothetical protein
MIPVSIISICQKREAPDAGEEATERMVWILYEGYSEQARKALANMVESESNSLILAETVDLGVRLDKVISRFAVTYDRMLMEDNVRLVGQDC